MNINHWRDTRRRVPNIRAVRAGLAFTARAPSNTNRSVINPIQFPGSVCGSCDAERASPARTFVSTNELAVFELQVPLGAGPRFFVPPIPRKQKRPGLIHNLPADFVAVQMPMFRNENGCR